MKQRKKPSLRFKGFDNDWEQRKIADVAEIITGGTPSTRIVEYWNPPEVPWLSSGEVHKKYITSTDTMISRKGYENSSATMVRENSVLIALAGQGKTRGTVAINRIPLSTNQSIAAMTFSDDIDPDYVFSNLENRYEELRSISSGDGSRGGLNKKLVGDVTIPCPTLLEQNAIGTLFRVLNELITLHQRKLEKLQNLKKAMLEKMFPKNGAKVPEIRFKGFTNDWEQRKLGNECFEIVAGGDVDKTKLLQDGKYPVIANALTDEGIIGYYSNEYRIKAPAVTVTGRGDVGHARARKINFTPVVRLLSVVSKHDVDFLAESINQNDIVLESTGVPQLTVPALANYLLCFPPTIKEEKRIGQYFSQLNHLLTLHQCKLEKLQNLKKAMLEKMFI